MRLLARSVPAVCLRLAAAQEWPKQKPVQVVVGFAPGATTDTVARIAAQKLQEALGQTFVVENRPGAGGNVATQQVKRAAADGYTILVTSVAYAVNPSLYANAGYDALTDFIAGGARPEHAEHHHRASRGAGEEPRRADRARAQAAARPTPPRASAPPRTCRWSA